MPLRDFDDACPDVATARPKLGMSDEKNSENHLSAERPKFTCTQTRCRRRLTEKEASTG
ncbi:hypothetical protein MPL3356_300003 [Mesorhizobium plurifarium]|uniref:Uncharacterized protein n=1 Tax=Mesorhizobium plurifarium TaxID=69974 RepID=A0A090FKM3_MESPL|nr:hypothetical protein MPL3356_300003 [Mesorhizobium plurifarium]